MGPNGIHVRIRQTEVHSLICPCGTTDVILVKYGCDGAVPVQRTFRIRLVDYTIFAAVQRNIVLFSRCDCRGKVCLEEGCLYILNAFVEKSLDILLESAGASRRGTPSAPL